MRQYLGLSVFCGLFLVACGQSSDVASDNLSAQGAKAKPIAMQSVTGLKTPESVVQMQDGRIFVTEINGFDVDGDGQITVVENGQAKVFVSGLDDPKGIVAKDSELYVADKTKILKINSQGEVSVFVETAAFPSQPVFLNDLEFDTLGNLFVSDSGDLNDIGRGAAIYKITPQGSVSLVINPAMNPLVKAPNGLLMDDTGDVLLFVDFASGVLYSYDMPSQTLTDLAEGFGGGDGLVHHSSGAMFVSDWKNGKVFMVNAAGDVVDVKSGYQAAADIALTKDEQYLMVPDFKAGVLDFIPVAPFIQ